MPTVLAVVGARPNFVKMAPVTQALAEREGVDVRLLHTGQHYDRALSDGFIERLGMPQPDANLGVGSGSHAEQTAKVMIGVEADLQQNPADIVLVAGDVNSTLAAALAATKLNIAVAHLESGLRSRDWSMPEEVNRIVDRPGQRPAPLHLRGRRREPRGRGDVGGRRAGRQHDDRQPLSHPRRRRPRGGARGRRSRAAQLRAGHAAPARARRRPRGARQGDRGARRDLARRCPSSSPPTRAPSPISRSAGIELPPMVKLARPMDYAEFIALEAEARLVITDSGGVQEETSALGVPCLTYRTHDRAAGDGRARHEHPRRGRSGCASRAPPQRSLRASRRTLLRASRTGTERRARALRMRSYPFSPDGLGEQEGGDRACPERGGGDRRRRRRAEQPGAGLRRARGRRRVDRQHRRGREGSRGDRALARVQPRDRRRRAVRLPLRIPPGLRDRRPGGRRRPARPRADSPPSRRRSTPARPRWSGAAGSSRGPATRLAAGGESARSSSPSWSLDHALAGHGPDVGLPHDQPPRASSSSPATTPTTSPRSRRS